MAYGMLADLPPANGLYTALLPAVAYTVCGTCMHLSVGPFALISMLTASCIRELVDDPLENPEAAAAIAAGLAAVCGVILLLLGLLRLGFIITFLSDPVLSGFCTAASLIIPVSQLKHALQVNVHAGTFFQMVEELVSQASKTNQYSFMIFLASLIAIFLLQRLNQSPPEKLKAFLTACPLPAELITAVIAGCTVNSMQLHECPGPCVRVVGHVPEGLPPVSLPSSDMLALWWGHRQVLCRAGLLTALMIYVISASVSKQFAAKYGYEVENNQECVSLGVANLLGAISGSYPAAASLSRTAIAASAGAMSPLHGLWTTLAVALMLMYCTWVVAPLPMATLAAIVVLAFKSLLINGFAEFKWSFKVSLPDFFVWNIAFWSTLQFNVAGGIAVAATTDVLLLLYRTLQPGHTVFGRLKSSETTYRNIAHFEDAEVVDGVLIYRFNAPMHFANREAFSQSVLSEVASVEELGLDAINAVVMDMSATSSIDMSACRSMVKLRQALFERSIRLILARSIYTVHKRLDKMGLFEGFDEDHWFDVVNFRDLHDAVLHAEQRLIQRAISAQLSESMASPTAERRLSSQSLFKSLGVDVGYTEESDVSPELHTSNGSLG
eukprot:TRINITY_DN29764_c0_g1_i2.p1 TRINITY_DN29764_c0_g1~~TRINITY_DN29764_c0_g1_i2.p1  ORF type:complete len:610 (-),score=65.72 TRINITY_DN29764_c0_g1_i2:280-2109(-)